MGQTLPEHVSLRSLIDLKLHGARFQISTLEQIGPHVEFREAAIESCVDAAIDQMLQALNVTLQQFNTLLPDPLPANRVSRRNLRDIFYAVESESHVLREIEAAARPHDGWLWWLEEKRTAGEVTSLVDPSADGEQHVWRDPLNPAARFEDGSPIDYLNRSLRRMSALIEQLLDQMADDIARYRDAQRQQARRLI